MRTTDVSEATEQVIREKVRVHRWRYFFISFGAHSIYFLSCGAYGVAFSHHCDLSLWPIKFKEAWDLREQCPENEATGVSGAKGGVISKWHQDEAALNKSGVPGAMWHLWEQIKLQPIPLGCTQWMEKAGGALSLGKCMHMSRYADSTLSPSELVGFLLINFKMCPKHPCGHVPRAWWRQLMIGLGHGLETGADWTNRTKTCTKTLCRLGEKALCVCKRLNHRNHTHRQEWASQIMGSPSLSPLCPEVYWCSFLAACDWLQFLWQCQKTAEASDVRCDVMFPFIVATVKPR